MKLNRYLRPAALALLLPALLLLAAPALAASLPPLGTAASFGVLAGSTVTNTGPTHVIGDVGVSPGTAVVGFPPGTLTGVIHAGDQVAAQAQNDAAIAYNNAAGQSCDFNLSGQNLGGMTLVSAVYCFDASAQLTGQLTLNGQGDPSSVFIFQIGSTLTTASSASVLLINGAQACRVFWQIGSSATLGTDTSFKGNILALTSITLNTTASSIGGLYARNGAVTLDDNNIQACGSAATPTSTPPAPTNTPLPVATDTPVAATDTPVVATDTPQPGATNTPAVATDTPQPGVTNTPAVATDTPPAPPTDTPAPRTTRTPLPPPPPPTNTAAPGATDTPVSQPTSQPTATVAPNNTQVAATETAMPINTQVAIATETAIAINTQVMGATATAIAVNTQVVAATATAMAINTQVAGVTNTATPIGTSSGSSVSLPHTGSGLPWASPLVLLLGALLLAAGLRLGGLRRKRLD